MPLILGCLMVALLVELAIGYRLFDSDCLSPFVLFAAGFAACALMLFLFNYWSYELHANTVLIVLLGITWFGVVCLVVRYIAKRSCSSAERAKGEFLSLPFRQGVLICIALIQIVIVVASAMAIAKRFPAATLAASIDAYGSASKFKNEDVSFGSLLDNARLASVMWTYFACFLLAQELQGRRWQHVVIASCSVMAGMVTQLETGGRQGALTFLLVTVFCYLLIHREQSARRPDVRKVLVIAGATVCLALGFRYAAVGRNTSGFDTMEYLTIYCGAQLANFDIFLGSEDWFIPETPGWMTFSGSYKWLARHVRFSSTDLDATSAMMLPFQSVEGRSLGNVYTCFYNYWIDFGLPGVIVLVAVMAALSQLIYERCCESSHRRDLWQTTYSFVAVQLLMSFFSDKFFSQFLTLAMLKGILFFLVFRWCYIALPRARMRRRTLVSCGQTNRQHFQLIVRE